MDIAGGGGGSDQQGSVMLSRRPRDAHFHNNKSFIDYGKHSVSQLRIKYDVTSRNASVVGWLVFGRSYDRWGAVADSHLKYFENSTYTLS